MVVGGGNVAMDAARTVRRLGAAETVVAYRRGREEMPAHAAEVDEAEQEGARFEFLVAPTAVVTDARGEVTGLRCARMRLVTRTPAAGGGPSRCRAASSSSPATS